MNMLQRFPCPEPPDHEFNWYEDRDDIVVTEQAAIAIYYNPNGDIVIRQKASEGEDHDSLIVVTPGLAGALARAIANASTPDSEPRNTTAAERQRRYRERHRNVTSVTPLQTKKRKEDQLL